LPIGTVGNGGFSLRRVPSCIAILRKWASFGESLRREGLPEDLFFMFAGVAGSDFNVPNEVTASKFAVEMNGPDYVGLTGTLPTGLHAWEK